MEEKLKVGKIYKIIDNTNVNIYIGSTTQTLNQRLSEHKNKHNRYINNKYHYVTSFEIIKNNNYKIELIKFVIFKDKKKLHQIERFYIENNICVNKTIPTRTVKEYGKEYRNINKDQIEELNKIKYQCECGSSIRIDSKSRHFKTLTHKYLINSK